MSQQPSQQPPWIWSPRLQQYYYYDRQNNHYVLQNGARLDVPRAMEAQSSDAAPRNPQNPPQPQFNIQSYRPHPSLVHTGQPYYDSYTTAAHAPQPSSSSSTGEPSTNQLASNLGALQVGDSRRPRVITNRRQVSFGYITEAFDTYTNVKTVSQTEPKDRITEESILRDGGVAHRKLDPTSETIEKLDPRFQVREKPTKFFCVGKVFLILWAEPAGSSNQSIVSNSTVTNERYSVGAFGEHVFQKVRRFVVVREGTQYCTALPVMTYGGQGVGKPKVKKSDHAIIYSGKSAPSSMRNEQPVRGERGMRPHSIRVVPDNKEEKLDPKSRIDFGKMHTIHHNLKVRPFGMVEAQSIPQLLNQFIAAMQDTSSKKQSGLSSRTNMPSTPSGTVVRDYVHASGSSNPPRRRVPQHEAQEGDEDSSNDGDDANESESEDEETHRKK